MTKRSDWISAKIKKLVAEGKPQDQAAAIAYSMWRDEARRNKEMMRTYDAMPAPDSMMKKPAKKPSKRKPKKTKVTADWMNDVAAPNVGTMARQGEKNVTDIAPADGHFFDDTIPEGMAKTRTSDLPPARPFADSDEEMPVVPSVEEQMIERARAVVAQPTRIVVTDTYFGKTAETAKAASKWVAGGAEGLPLDDKATWDGAAAKASIFAWAGFDGDHPDGAKAAKGFLVHDSANPTLKGSYKLPFAHVSGGKLTAVAAGIRNAASRLPQTDGLSADVQKAARSVIDHYEKKMNPATASDSKMFTLPDQDEVNYLPLSDTPGQACANCRFYLAGQGGCYLIENGPEPILPTGVCDRWENGAMPDETDDGTDVGSLDDDIAEVGAAAQGDMPDMSMMNMERSTTTGGFVTPHTPLMVADGSGHKETFRVSFTGKDLNTGETTSHTWDVHDHAGVNDLAYGYIAPDSAKVSKLKALAERFKVGLKPQVSVLKDADGRRYMLIVTSNSYEDRDGETITTAALKEWVDRQWKAEDQFISDNVLDFWHYENFDIGQIVWADMRGPFLVEVAKEADHPVARVIFDYVEAHPEEKWGASQKFGYYPSDRLPDGTFKRVIKKRTTVLPRDAAANVLTLSGVVPMVSKREEALNKMFKVENAAEILEKRGFLALVEELNKQGVTHKGSGAPVAAEAETDKAQQSFGKLLEDVMDSQLGLIEMVDGVVEKSKALETENTALKTDLLAEFNRRFGEVSQQMDALKAQLDARPRSAAKAVETEVDPQKLPAEVVEAMQPPLDFFGSKYNNPYKGGK